MEVLLYAGDANLANDGITLGSASSSYVDSVDDITCIRTISGRFSLDEFAGFMGVEALFYEETDTTILFATLHGELRVPYFLMGQVMFSSSVYEESLFFEIEHSVSLSCGVYMERTDQNMHANIESKVTRELNGLATQELLVAVILPPGALFEGFSFSDLVLNSALSGSVEYLESDDPFVVEMDPHHGTTFSRYFMKVTLFPPS